MSRLKGLPDEQYVARRSVRDPPGGITNQNERLAKRTADEATAQDHAGDPVIIGGHGPARKLDLLPVAFRDTHPCAVGHLSARFTSRWQFGCRIRGLRPD